MVWERLGEKFLYVYPKWKVFSVENRVMDLSEGFSVFTSPSESSSMQLPSQHCTAIIKHFKKGLELLESAMEGHGDGEESGGEATQGTAEVFSLLREKYSLNTCNCSQCHPTSSAML